MCWFLKLLIKEFWITLTVLTFCLWCAQITCYYIIIMSVYNTLTLYQLTDGLQLRTYLTNPWRNKNDRNHFVSCYIMLLFFEDDRKVDDLSWYGWPWISTSELGKKITAHSLGLQTIRMQPYTDNKRLTSTSTCFVTALAVCCPVAVVHGNSPHIPRTVAQVVWLIALKVLLYTYWKIGVLRQSKPARNKSDETS
jgi:hypothetical protein